MMGETIWMLGMYLIVMMYGRLGYIREGGSVCKKK